MLSALGRLRRPRPGFAVLVLVAAVAAAVLADSADTRLPVPEPNARGPVLAEVKKEFRDDLRAKGADVKRTIVRKLLERAKAADVDPVRRFVQLDFAVSVAEESRDVGLALEAVDALAAAFQVEAAARGLAAVDAITHGAKETSVLAEAANACVELTGRALADDDANVAGKAISAAKTNAKTAKLGGLAARVAEIAELVGAFRRASTAAEVARAVLATTPDDPAANESVGRFLCFGRGRWDEGLPHLAKSGDAALASVAAKEVAKPGDAAARQSVADAWWDLGQKEKDPLARARMLGRAAASYDSTPPDAPEDRTKVVKERLDALTYRVWDRGVALTKDFSKDGPVSLALATVREFIAQQKIDRKSSNWRLQLPRPPEVVFGRGEEYLWRLETNVGVITLRFFPDTAPKHVANFLYLTELGFFDGLNFHRVIPGFMAQGGCPKRDGSGNPGYFLSGETSTVHKHDKPGVLSIANTGEPTTDGSQFFITFAAADHLDGKHTVFGEVIDGMDAVRKLEAQGTPEGKPKSELEIVSARVSMR